MAVCNVTMKIGGRDLLIETGRIAKQAHGSCVVRYGDTVILATVCAVPLKTFQDFFPLSVEFRERTYAFGKIPGGFFKREGRPPEESILAGRMIDRPLRPLFPDDYREEVQIMVTPLTMDKDNSPQALSITAASAALAVSNIPFDGPVGAVRMGMIGDEYIVNIHDNQLEQSKLDIFVAGTKHAVTMVEAGAKEASEAEVLQAIRIAHDEIKKIVAIQEELRAKVGAKIKEYTKVPTDQKIEEEIKKTFRLEIREAVKVNEKIERARKLDEVSNKILNHFSSSLTDENKDEKTYVIKNAVEALIGDEVRYLIAKERYRADGRGVKDIRPIESLVDVLPRVHGSSLFTRGQTQALAVVTIGTSRDAQIVEAFGIEGEKNFMLHYNFPPFSVGEVKRITGPGRREIGHGALAERAIAQMLPKDPEVFPYTVRVVSEILESNGSSSMATVCATSLALMDAGVPLMKPVAGIAMGLVKEGADYTVLTDIQGLEDHYGDMDFKVAGTAEGITALQMDIKIKGLDFNIMEEALAQAKEARLFIHGKMAEAISQPRKELSPFAPRITSMRVDPEKIKDIIGPGGKVIRKITAECDVEIDIEDDGLVKIFSDSAEKSAKAARIINDLTAEAEVGKVYQGRVTRIMNFGAFVEILPGKEGLVHISQLDSNRVNRVEDVVNVGDEVTVKCVEIDSMGRVNLSRKAML
ncbi:MAG: polyribonucleotide nucleotidyltransferase [Candidatus Wallbacteria bacterium]|nr:polyribonucleotide nucleotidyltransferase [Candidatus Wallbacteria bacterium]